VRATSILVADGSPIFRAGVRNLLQRESEFEVAEAGDVQSFVALVDDQCPDIALVDLNLPPSGGVAAVSELSQRCPTVTIVWSFEASRETVLAAIRAGASGYLHKEISPAGLVRSLRGVVRGEAPLARDLATLMIGALHGLEERERSRDLVAVLSPREREVLAHVAKGARNRQIAQALYISEFTVKRHMQNILHKLGLPSRRAAAAHYRAAFDLDGVALGVSQTA
jgi:DNA-binding NarL/FixJ family response regulator